MPGEKGTQFKVALLATATAAERLTLDAMRRHAASECPACLIERR